MCKTVSIVHARVFSQGRVRSLINPKCLLLPLQTNIRLFSDDLLHVYYGYFNKYHIEIGRMVLEIDVAI